MVIDRTGATFKHKGTTYIIGEAVIGTDASEYKGLYGTITEIRDGDNKETENDTPDIYCCFEPPVLPHEIEDLKKTFSCLCGEPKELDDICLDEVIMAPEMIKPLGTPEKDCPDVPVFAIIQDWASDGSTGCTVELCANYEDARYIFHNRLHYELHSSILDIWKHREDFCTESSEDFYEGYLDGQYSENHYSIQIEQKSLYLTDNFLTLANAALLKKRITKSCYEKGVAEGKDQMAALLKLLLSENRIAEFNRVLEDSIFRAEMIAKYITPSEA